MVSSCRIFKRLLSQQSRMVTCGFSGFPPQQAETQIEAFVFLRSLQVTQNLAPEVVVRKGPGRPSTFPLENTIWTEIIEQVSDGKSLSSTLRAPGMPSYSLARQMIKNNPEFRNMYEKAMEDRADRLAEEIIELADQDMPDGLEGSLASAWVQQKRMQVDARKWVASKLHAKRYGERLDVSVTDTRISVLDALNEAKQRVLTDDSNVVDVQAKAG